MECHFDKNRTISKMEKINKKKLKSQSDFTEQSCYRILWNAEPSQTNRLQETSKGGAWDRTWEKPMAKNSSI